MRQPLLLHASSSSKYTVCLLGSVRPGTSPSPSTTVRMWICSWLTFWHRDRQAFRGRGRLCARCDGGPEEALGDERGHHGREDDHRDQHRILCLRDDAVGQSEEGGDG